MGNLRKSSLPLFLFLATILLAGRTSATDLPLSGTTVPELAPFDDAMVEFMESKGIEDLIAVIRERSGLQANLAGEFSARRRVWRALAAA